MKTSVLIPVYNYEGSLEQTIKNIRENADVFEIVLVWDVTKGELEEKIISLSKKLE